MVNDIYRNHKIYFRALFILLSISICSFIFFFSNQNAKVSADTSGEIVIKISRFVFEDFEKMDLEKQQSIVESLQFFIRKSAHFIIYMALGFSVCGIYSTFAIKCKHMINFSLLTCLLYAISDEIHQFFVAGRSCELRDVCIDSGGAFFGILAFMLIVKIFTSIRDRSFKI